MKLLGKALKPMTWFIVIALIIKTAGTLVELVIPYILSHILDEVVPDTVNQILNEAVPENQGLRDIIFWGALMVVCSLLALIGNVVANRMAAKVARNCTEKIRNQLFERTMTLSARQIDRFTVPSLESRITSDTYHVHNMVGMSMRMGVRAPILLIGGLLVTSLLDWRLTLVMACVLPLIGITVFFITSRGVPLFKKNQIAVDGMTAVVRENAQGVRVIKALSRGEYEKKRYDAANKTLVASETKASTTMAFSNPIVTFLLNFGLVSVMVVGAMLVTDGLTAPGRIIAFIQYFTIMSNAMMAITRIFANITRGSASAARIEEVINTPEDMAVASKEAYPDDPAAPYLSFENVTFSYLGHRANLDHVTVGLEKGKTLGIIGATGSGKSTLLHLLLRFYDVDEGNIRVGGEDVRTMPREILNTRFGIVMQNDFLFAGSIADNIRFGRDLTDEQVREAAAVAQASEFIEAFEDGYDHILTSKGTNLSGGQKQRVLIARAVAGSPDILVLDDSSSALDYKTDASLRKALRENRVGMTTVVVAQRVSSVMNADRILVLDDGKIIGNGTHEELLASCPVYREISDSQIGGAFLE